MLPILPFLFVSGGLRGNYRTSGGLEKEEAGKQCLLHAKSDPLYISEIPPPPSLLISVYCRAEKPRNMKYYLNFRLLVQLG